MEYLRINENKLKITLTQEELRFYGMDLADLSYSSTETRRAFWAILDDAKHATGFDAAASRVSIRIFASRTGGCEMFVIGLPKDASPESDEGADAIADLLRADPQEVGCTALCSSSARSVESGSTLAPRSSLPHRFAGADCEFLALSHLLDACTALRSGGYTGESSAWWMNDRYYLSLAGSDDSLPRRPSRLSASGIVQEFGTILPKLNLTYLAEHGKCLCPSNAVDQLARLAT